MTLFRIQNEKGYRLLTGSKKQKSLTTSKDQLSVLFSTNDNITLIKLLIGTASIAIGINLWLEPQISLHWPKYSPVRSTSMLSWFSRPGTASALIPITGIVQQCRTSAEEIRIRIGTRVGMIIRWSVSNRR